MFRFRRRRRAEFKDSPGKREGNIRKEIKKRGAAESVFSSATRTHSIYFQYAWSEQDESESELSKEFPLDSAEAPGDVADAQKIGSLKALDRVNNKIVYKRDFYFGNSGFLLFPVSRYEPLKSLFDAFHKADTHTLTLKQK